VIRAKVRENRFDGRAIGKLDAVFGMAYDFSKPPEEKYLHARCL
jgi:hypothetical protein